jgi:single-strand DNA-binding protein
MINRVVLMGRLTANPELKTTPSGVSVTSFSIAVDRSYVKQGEERKADFINIVCWRNTAEFVCRYFEKGSLIALEGQLQSRTYQDKNENNRTVIEVVADNVSFTGEKRETQVENNQPYVNTPPAQQGFTQQNYNNTPAYQQEFKDMPLDDSLPF